MADEARLGFGEFLQDIGRVIVAPARRFSLIHERGVLWGSLFLLIAPTYFPFSYLGGIYFDRDPFPGYALFLPAAAAVLFSCLKAFCIHLVARLLEGKGRYFAAAGKLRDLFVVIGYTGVPSIIALLLALIVFLVLPGQFGYLFRNFHAATVSVLIGMGLALFIWNLILMVLALRKVYPMRDIKIVAAVILGPILFAAPAMSLSLLARSVNVDATYLAPLLNEKMMRIFAADPSSEDTKSRKIEVHVDHLAYKYKEPKRFDLAFFYPIQALPGKEDKAEKGGVVIGSGAGASLDKKNPAVGRLIALPGERVEILQGKLFINGRIWLEPYLEPEWQSDFSIPARMLGASEYFILPADRRLLKSGCADIFIPRDRIAGRMVTNRYPLGWWLFRPSAFLKGHPQGESATP